MQKFSCFVYIMIMAFSFTSNIAFAEKENVNREFTGLFPPKGAMNSSVCSDNGYRFNRSIGLRTIICLYKNYFDFNRFEKISSIQVFGEGSKKDPFDTKLVSNFNRLNPQFIEWVIGRYKETKDDFGYRDYYQTYFKDLIRIYFAVGYSLKKNEQFFNEHYERYKHSLSSGEKIDPSSLNKCKNIFGSWPESYKTNYRYKDSCYNQCRTASNVAYFWFRRRLDGSMDSLMHLLEMILNDFDEKFYADVQSFTKVYTDKECIEERERND